MTNVSAMTALQTLTTTQKALAKTQDQVSSGLRVGSTQDNAAYWSIGVGMKSQAGGLSAVTDGLALTTSIADVTASALVSIKASLDKMQDDIVTARQPGVSLSATQTDIAAQQQSILDAVNSASFNGSNWLKNTITTNHTIDTEMSVSVSKDDWNAIARGQEPNKSFNFASTVTDTDTANRNGD